MPRYEAIGAKVVDHETGAVVANYSGLVVLTEAGKRQAIADAESLNKEADAETTASSR